MKNSKSKNPNSLKAQAKVNFAWAFFLTVNGKLTD
jgi:hypothetical protein